MQLTFGAERVDDAVGDHRHRARPFVEAEVVPVRRRVGVPPLPRAGPRVERLDDLLVGNAMKEQHAVLDHGGPGKRLPDLLAPHDFWACGAPELSESGGPV